MDFTSQNIFCNETYLCLFFEFLTILDIMKIITISKYHLVFLNDKKRNKLVKKLISHYYGNIWSTYSIKLSFKSKTNLQFIKMLFTDFRFIMSICKPTTCSRIRHEEILVEFCKSNCITYWGNILNRKINYWYAFKKASCQGNWPVNELFLLLQNFVLDVEHFKWFLYSECVNVHKKLKVTNSIIALLKKSKEDNIILVPSYATVFMIFDVFLLLMFGVYHFCEYGHCCCFVRRLHCCCLVQSQYMEHYNITDEPNDLISYLYNTNDFISYLNNNNLMISNAKYVISQLIRCATKYKSFFFTMIKNSLFFFGNFGPCGRVLQNEECHNAVKTILLDCFS